MAYLGAIGVAKGGRLLLAGIRFGTVLARNARPPYVRTVTVAVKVRTLGVPARVKVVTRETVRRSLPGRLFKRIPWWTSDSRPAHTIPTTGAIQGTVQQIGVPLVGGQVFLYYRKNGRLIEEAVTGANGSFSFMYLDPTDYYYIVAVDDDKPPMAVYNAKVVDFVNPVI